MNQRVIEPVIERADDHRSAGRVTRSQVLHALVALGLVAGCGGKHADTTPSGGGTGGGGDTARGDEQVPPEKMDEINRDLDRKRPIMSRCLAIAVDNKELPKNSAGKITLEIVIAGGKAETVKVVRSTLESEALKACVVRHVQEIAFPDLPKPYETSYTYGFEAM